jgi:hypothetical protein
VKRIVAQSIRHGIALVDSNKVRYTPGSSQATGWKSEDEEVMEWTRLTGTPL